LDERKREDNKLYFKKDNNVKPLDYHGLNEIYSKSFGQMYVFLGDHYGRCDIAKGHYIDVHFRNK